MNSKVQVKEKIRVLYDQYRREGRLQEKAKGNWLKVLPRMRRDWASPSYCDEEVAFWTRVLIEAAQEQFIFFEDI